MLVPVILSGGVGARLWPVSRESYPKPFIRLADGQSLLQKTLQRASVLEGASTVITVTNHEYVFATRDEYRSVQGALDLVFLLEPSARNTAPAIAMAALYAMQRWGNDAILLILPADHVVDPLPEFQAAVSAAQRLAGEGRMVVFGVKPTVAETAYGYIESGAPAGANIFDVKRFVEKPPAQLAAEFLDSGHHFWNSGMFCFTARTFLDKLRLHAPQLHAAAEVCWNATRDQTGDAIRIDAGSFA